jgi:hypothetical protein
MGGGRFLGFIRFQLKLEWAYIIKQKRVIFTQIQFLTKNISPGHLT